MIVEVKKVTKIVKIVKVILVEVCSFKNGVGDFQNSSRFKISTYFYVTITRDFELFQY